MNKLEEQLTHAAQETRTAISRLESRPATSIGSRRRTHQVFLSVTAVAAVFAVALGTAAIMTTSTPNHAAPFTAAASDSLDPHVFMDYPPNLEPLGQHMGLDVYVMDDADGRACIGVQPGDDLLVCKTTSSWLAPHVASWSATHSQGPSEIYGLISADTEAVRVSFAGNGTKPTSPEVQLATVFPSGPDSPFGAYILEYNMSDYGLAFRVEALDGQGNVLGSFDLSDGCTAEATLEPTLREFCTEVAAAQAPAGPQPDDSTGATTDTTMVFSSEAEADAWAEENHRSRLEAAIAGSTVVARTEDITEAPVVVQCTGGDDYPNETGTVNLGVVDTATDALVDFIRDKTHWYPEGYTQFNLPDGNIVFGYPFESDPTLSVINVWVVQSDNGWQVDSWESSAC